MKALTIRQPWASLIATGVKTIETRSWSTKYRGLLLVHAGMARPASLPGYMLARPEYDLPWRLQRWSGDGRVFAEMVENHLLPLGAVVAVAQLVDVVPITDYHDTGWPAPVEGAHALATDGHDLLEHWVVGEAVCADGVDWTAASGHPTWTGDWNADLEDQLPLGDFTPGRYAWLLDIVRRIYPVPAKGRQGLWTPAPELVLSISEEETDHA